MSEKVDFDWNCQQVAALFNLFPSWDLQIKSTGMGSSKLLLYDTQNPECCIKAKLFPNFKMAVKANLAWIVKYWNSQITLVVKDRDERNRVYKRGKTIEMYSYNIIFNIQDTSTFIIFNALYAIYYPPELFTNSYNYFCHYLWFEKKLPKLNENSFINDFIQTFVKRPEKEADTSFDAFKKSFDGYVKFDIAHDSPELRKFPIIDYNDEKWRILGGIYISNYASTIIEKKQ